MCFPVFIFLLDFVSVIFLFLFHLDIRGRVRGMDGYWMVRMVFDIGKGLFFSAIEHSVWGSEQTVYEVWGEAGSWAILFSTVLLLSCSPGVLLAQHLFENCWLLRCSSAGLFSASSPFDWIGGFASAAICKEGLEK